MLKTTSFAKICRPVCKDALPRERLFKRLDDLRRAPVIWISGPPGSGKTTLVSSYIEALELDALWYQVDIGDAEAAGFFHYFSLAGKKAAPRRRKALPVFSVEHSRNLPFFCKHFFRDLFSRLKQKTVVVFDNYQEALDSKELNEVISKGIEEVPDGINVIVISHNDPPDNCSRLIANGHLKRIEWNDLRLTGPEARAIALGKSITGLSEEILDSINQKTDGWAAGLVLMIERIKAGLPTTEIKNGQTPAIIFDYFLSEVFNKLDTETRDFLMMTSVLPSMTSSMAAELTSNEGAASVLSGLYKRNCFTLKHHLHGSVSYQYHYLFREFLLLRFRESFTRQRKKEISSSAARLLYEDGQISEAVELYKESDEWGSISRIILSEAPLMIKQGRNRQLGKWIDALPSSLKTNSPWLIYWNGRSRLNFYPLEGLNSFEKSYESFTATDDIDGTILSICGAIDAIFFGYKGHIMLKHWIDNFFDIKKSRRELISPELRDQVTQSIFFALVSMRSDHEEFDEWLSKSLMIVDGKGDSHRRIMIGSYLVIYYVWKGEFRKVEMLIKALGKIKLPEDASPLLQIRLISAEQLYYLNTGDKDECLNAAERGLAIASESGVHLWDSQFLGVSAVVIASSEYTEEAESFLDLMAESVEEVSYSSKLHFTNYYTCRCWLAYLEGDLLLAKGYAEKSLDSSQQLTGTWFEALSRHCMAYILNDCGEQEAAEEQVALVRSIATRMKSSLFEFMCLMAEAKFALDSGDEGLTVTKLSAAMRVGRENNYTGYCYWSQESVSVLCGKALSLGIEVEYVKRLIRKRGLKPASFSMNVEEWPRPIRVYTLGLFEVFKDDSPLKFSKKAPKKPLELLKLLISFGDNGAGKELLCDMLWPDSDGDSANRAFITNLGRLRKLLGSEESLHYSDGRLDINRAYCWVDSLAFEEMERAASESIKDGEMGKALSIIEYALRLYRGEFLSGEPAGPWAIKKIEELKSKATRTAITAGGHYEDSGRIRMAIKYYRMGLSIDLLQEELCYHIMSCFMKEGLRGEAVSEYLRYARIFEASYGMEPSQKLKSFHESIILNVNESS